MTRFENMTDDEFYKAITGEEKPSWLRRQADLGPEIVPFDTRKPDSVEVDGVMLPGWLVRKEAEPYSG